MSKPEPDDLNDISALWQQQSAGSEASFAIAEKQKHQRRFLQDWFLAFVMLLFGALFLGLSRSPVYLVAATAFFIGAVLQLRLAYDNRNRTLQYDDWSARGLIEYRLLLCETQLQRCRYNQYGIAIVVLFTLLLAVMRYVLDFAIPTDLIVVYYVILPFLLGSLWYFQRRIAEQRKRLAHLQQMLKEFVEADDV